MKKLFYVLLPVFVILFVACGPTKEDAIEFNDSMVKDQKDILALEDNLINSIVDWNYESSKSDLKVYQEKLTEILEKYEAMDAFDKEDEFRLAMINLCKVLKEMSETNYPDAIEYITLSETLDSLPDEPLIELLDILDEIDIVSDEANEKFLDAQKTFAEKYELQLSKSE